MFRAKSFRCEPSPHASFYAVRPCGLSVGSARDFALDVGTTGSGDSSDFVHTLNFNVAVPEPGTGLLFGLGLLALAGSRRR
ncbi:MAG: PEP-CTERM sorting domain-containing protein [Myxococcota bacterium]|nr:PEP-CTERM sorting domain-containing protein [Myxococcota bacterium]